MWANPHARVIELVRDEAASFGITLTKAQAECIIWEKTGFPCFFHIGLHGLTSEHCLLTQVRQALGKANKTVWYDREYNVLDLE